MLLVYLRRKVTISDPFSQGRLVSAFVSTQSHALRVCIALEGARGRRSRIPHGDAVSFSGSRVFSFAANWGRRTENFLRCCKILKQAADRSKVETRCTCGAPTTPNLDAQPRENRRCQTLVSESEAKFFLDSPGQRKYVDPKFFGADHERAKIHLLAFRNLLNCRTYSGGGDLSPVFQTSARLRKAESRKQGLKQTVELRTKASGKRDSWDFFFSRLTGKKAIFEMNGMQANVGGRGDDHIA